MLVCPSLAPFFLPGVPFLCAAGFSGSLGSGETIKSRRHWNCAGVVVAEGGLSESEVSCCCQRRARSCRAVCLQSVAWAAPQSRQVSGRRRLSVSGVVANVWVGGVKQTDGTGAAHCNARLAGARRRAAGDLAIQSLTTAKSRRVGTSPSTRQALASSGSHWPHPRGNASSTPAVLRLIPARVLQRLVYTPETLLSLRKLLSREHP
jgi:hypothetical protein